MKEVSADLIFEDDDMVLDDHGNAIYKDEDSDDRYAGTIGVDWKDSPDTVMEAVNKDLKERGIDLEYTLLNDGSDSYWFGTKIIE